jgi:hypothetical protein
MKKRVKEESVRTITVALVGFATLMIAVPDWARAGVLVFAGVFAVLACAVDRGVREAVLDWVPGHRRGSGDRDDVKSGRAKPPGGRPAAT